MAEPIICYTVLCSDHVSGGAIGESKNHSTAQQAHKKKFHELTRHSINSFKIRILLTAHLHEFHWFIRTILTAHLQHFNSFKLGLHLHNHDLSKWDDLSLWSQQQQQRKIKQNKKTTPPCLKNKNVSRKAGKTSGRAFRFVLCRSPTKSTPFSAVGFVWSQVLL